MNQYVALHITPKGVVSYVDKLSERSTDDANEKLWDAIRRPRQEETGVHVTHRLEDGDPAQQIVRVARETHCDLIVMGLHQRSAPARWFCSSTTDEVIRKAPCSVLVVKAPMEEIQEESEEAPVVTETHAHSV